jgi:hypothetical protein
LNKKSDEIGARLDAKRSKGVAPCEYLQRRMAPISSLFFDELLTQDTDIAASSIADPGGKPVLSTEHTGPLLKFIMLPSYSGAAGNG